MDNTRKKLQLINQHLSRAPKTSEDKPVPAHLQMQAANRKQRVYAAADDKSTSKHLLPRQRSDVELTQQTASTSNFRTPLRSNTLEGDLHSHFEETTVRSRPSQQALSHRLKINACKMLLHTLSKKVYAQRMAFWLPFRHVGLSDNRSIEISPSASPKHRRTALGSIDFSEQVFDKSEL